MKFNTSRVTTSTNSDGVDTARGGSFVLYKYSADVFQLEVARWDIGVGISVYHYLTPVEISRYLKSGVSALEDRLNDMHDHYASYRVASFR